MGYGLTESGKGSKVLKCVKLNVLDTEECSNLLYKWSNYRIFHQMCTHYGKGKPKDACHVGLRSCAKYSPLF